MCGAGFDRSATSRSRISAPPSEPKTPHDGWSTDRSELSAGEGSPEMAALCSWGAIRALSGGHPSRRGTASARDLPGARPRSHVREPFLLRSDTGRVIAFREQTAAAPSSAHRSKTGPLPSLPEGRARRPRLASELYTGQTIPDWIEVHHRTPTPSRRHKADTGAQNSRPTEAGPPGRGSERSLADRVARRRRRRL